MPTRISRSQPRSVTTSPETTVEIEAEETIQDYRIAYRSRRISVVGRNEVISGRAQFGIFGDGKEIPQVAVARAMRPGDWRAGYYRDQTWMLATKLSTPREIFAQLYGDADTEREPSSGGRNVVNISATRLLDANGEWISQLHRVNAAAGYGAVATQMAGSLGLAYASKLYRVDPGMAAACEGFSLNGDEVTFASIGNGAAAEGIFFEVMNAAVVLQVPLVVSVWDDGYAISVANEYEMAHSSVSRAIGGLAWDGNSGLSIYEVTGWDYVRLRSAYEAVATQARKNHRPSLVHVTELTQPMGHSTTGSHEKYKSRERLDWEAQHDCVAMVRSWLIESDLATEYEIEHIEHEETEFVNAERDLALAHYQASLREFGIRADEALTRAGFAHAALKDYNRRTVQSALSEALVAARGRSDAEARQLANLAAEGRRRGERLYRSHLFSDSKASPVQASPVVPEYPSSPEHVDGRTILVRFFDAALARDPRIFVIGEDVGRLGDVNLVYEGLQAKYGETRLTDTGIREATILGQGIGCALRGLRPIVDIQYLDYFLFALEIASDDLATLYYRTAGGQKAPLVIRTKGHRLVGITHSGSPMALLLGSCRGIYICVPRDMTRAAGMYGALLLGDNPGIVIEVLNGYWTKEPMPTNLARLVLPLGNPEVLRRGTDLTVVTYGAMCRIVMQAAIALSEVGVELEVIDVQTLSPFDINHSIVKSVQKTGAVLFADEDVPGGATAFMMREVLEVQGGYEYLDSAPKTLTSAENRPAYSNDGDYFSKPSVDDVVHLAYEMARERRPDSLPPLPGAH